MAAKITDSIKRFARLIKTYLDFAVIIVFSIFLVYIGARVYLEFNSPEPMLEPLQPWNPADLFDNDEEYKKVLETLEQEPTLEENERFISLGKFNMFDYKIVRDRDIIRKELDDKFEQAQRFYNEGKLNSSRKILLEILSSWPSHLRSRELLDKIDAELNPTPTPSPTPSPGPMPGEIPPPI